jgi:hypothetical protein
VNLSALNVHSFLISQILFFFSLVMIHSLFGRFVCCCVKNQTFTTKLFMQIFLCQTFIVRNHSITHNLSASHFFNLFLSLCLQFIEKCLQWVKHKVWFSLTANFFSKKLNGKSSKLKLLTDSVLALPSMKKCCAFVETK